MGIEVFEVFRGVTGDARMMLIRRRILEIEVQNLVGQITNIADLSMATLYGLRDRERRRVGLMMKETEA